MMKLERPAAPQFLKENYKIWGKEYKRTSRFRWKKYKKVLQALKEASHNHCSFCDGYPIGGTAREIEHFRPRESFPLLAFVWENLFYCCSLCNKKKGRRFSRKLLKPDKAEYSFEKFFIYSYANGIISPNPRCSVEDKERAETTIEFYGLNDYDRPEARVEAWEGFLDANNPNKEKRPYRFILR